MALRGNLCATKPYCSPSDLFPYKTEVDCAVTETTGTVYVNVYVSRYKHSRHAYSNKHYGAGGFIYTGKGLGKPLRFFPARERQKKVDGVCRNQTQPAPWLPAAAAAPPAGAGPGLHQPLRFLRAWITQRASLWRRRIEETAQEEENGINNPAVAAASGTLQRLTEGPDSPHLLLTALY